MSLTIKVFVLGRAMYFFADCTPRQHACITCISTDLHGHITVASVCISLDYVEL